MTTINGYWAKAWDGYLLHFWLPNHGTLCGKTHMVPHTPRSFHAPARGPCKHCQKKYDKLVAEREEEQQP